MSERDAVPASADALTTSMRPSGVVYDARMSNACLHKQAKESIDRARTKKQRQKRREGGGYERERETRERERLSHKGRNHECIQTWVHEWATGVHYKQREEGGQKSHAQPGIRV